MRRGIRAWPWTVEEERWLRENAGKVSRRACCLHLRRNSEAVKQKAKLLGVSLRHWDPRCAETCPECGTARTSMGRSGTCRPCELRALIAKADAEKEEAMAALDPDSRAVYQATEAKLGSELPPKPAAPKTDGMSIYEVAKEHDLHAAAMEAWEVKALTRQLKAKRRRLERMREKFSNQ